MCKDLMTKWKVLVLVGAGMFLFSLFGEAKMDIRGTPCLAKNDTALSSLQLTVGHRTIAR